MVLELGGDPLVITGGLALNSCVNELIARESGNCRSFFYSASHDSGVSIGAAAAGHFLRSGTHSKAPGHDFLGIPYIAEDIDRALRRVGDRWRDGGEPDLQFGGINCIFRIRRVEPRRDRRDLVNWRWRGFWSDNC